MTFTHLIHALNGIVVAVKEMRSSAELLIGIAIEKLHTAGYRRVVSSAAHDQRHHTSPRTGEAGTARSAVSETSAGLVLATLDVLDGLVENLVRNGDTSLLG